MAAARSPRGVDLDADDGLVELMLQNGGGGVCLDWMVVQQQEEILTACVHELSR